MRLEHSQSRCQCRVAALYFRDLGHTGQELNAWTEAQFAQVPPGDGWLVVLDGGAQGQGLGFITQASGFKLQSLGFGVQDLGFGIRDLGFKV